ncbi:MAG: tripartite tricarboxylate transporter substrate-binding protein [Pseudomonadota bacterium]
MKQLRVLLATALAALVPYAAWADSYPSRPITLIVPFSAGGPTDVVARSLAVAMGSALGQPVIVENRASSGGIVGSEAVVRAEPDGYMLLVHNIGLSTLPALARGLRFDPLKDFAYIGQVVDVPMTLVGRRDLAPAGFAELRPYIAAKEKQLNIANAGIGTASHLCGLLLMNRLGVSMTTVPYKGAAPAMTDLMGGQVDLMCDQVTTTTPPILSQRVKAYGTTTGARLANLPEVRTLQEQGLENFEVSVWHGIYAPRRTPKAVVDRLSAALRTALADPGFKSSMARLGAVPVDAAKATPEGLQEKLRTEITKWTPVIEKSQAYLD